MVHVYAGKGFIMDTGASKYVYPPNWFERLIGITFKGKVHAATARVADICVEKNAVMLASRAVVAEIKGELK